MGMVLVYALQGALRYSELRFLFGWRLDWSALARPIVATAAALVPSCLVLALAQGSLAELVAGLGFLSGYFLAWRVLGLEESDRLVWQELQNPRKSR